MSELWLSVTEYITLSALSDNGYFFSQSKSRDVWSQGWLSGSVMSSRTAILTVLVMPLLVATRWLQQLWGSHLYGTSKAAAWERWAPFLGISSFITEDMVSHHLSGTWPLTSHWPGLGHMAISGQREVRKISVWYFLLPRWKQTSKEEQIREWLVSRQTSNCHSFELLELLNIFSLTCLPLYLWMHHLEYNCLVHHPPFIWLSPTPFLNSWDITPNPCLMDYMSILCSRLLHLSGSVVISNLCSH